jgi:hypothetical protein
MKYNDIEKFIDNFIQSNSVKINDTELISLLLVPIYSKLFTNRKKESLVSIIVKRILVLIYGFKNKKVIEFKNFNVVKPSSVFVISYSINDKRNSSILTDILPHLEPETFLVITDKDNVYEWCTQHNYNCILTVTPKWIIDKRVKSINISYSEKIVLSRGISNFLYADKLLTQYKPKTLLTIQDFHINERAYTIVAKNLNIKTITHQHGLITVGHNLFLFKFTLSDIVMAWGQSSAQLFKKWLPNSEVITIGTDKFNDYNQVNTQEKSFITIGINPIPYLENKKLIKQILEQFIPLNDLISQHHLQFVLKLHPQLRPEFWVKAVNDLEKELGCPYHIEVLWQNNKSLLEKTRILLVSTSSLAIEGFMAKASVIDINRGEIPPPLFVNIANSFIELHQLSDEIRKRLENPDYSKSIIDMQDKQLALEISNTNSSYKESQIIMALK